MRVSFTVNGRREQIDVEPRRTLAAKYAPLVPVLRELIALPDTPLEVAARQRILGQLDRAAERFAAILPSS